MGGFKRKTSFKKEKVYTPREVQRDYDPSRLGKRSIAFVFGYNGIGYNGLQIQNGQDLPTIEKDIQEALLKSAAILPGEDLSAIHWCRAGRTDKGVHAACNVLSGRVHVYDPELGALREAHRLAQEAAKAAQAEAAGEATATSVEGEEAKEEEDGDAAKRPKTTGARTLVPGEVENSIADVMGSGELYKDVDIQWQLDEIAAEGLSVTEVEKTALRVVEGRMQDIVKKINSHLPAQIRIIGWFRVNRHFDARTSCDSREYEYLLPTSVFASKSIEGLKDAADPEGFEGLTRLNETLQTYQGTHFFHNFTNNIKPMDAQAQRFIISIGASPVTHDGTNFFKISLHGQSFLLHQIRRMIGGAVAVLRGDMPPSSITEALTVNERRNTPTAPAEGLFLCNTHFEGYSEYKAQMPITFPLNMHRPELLENIEKVKRELIYPEIVEQAVKNQVWDKWLAEESGNWQSLWDLQIQREIVAKEEAAKAAAEKAERAAAFAAKAAEEAATEAAATEVATAPVAQSTEDSTTDQASA